MPAFTEEIVDVGGVGVHTLKGGSGDPLLLLHGAGGNSGWLRSVDALAEHYTVYYPSHPGYGKSPRPEWLESIPDMAAFYTWYLDTWDWSGSAPSASPWAGGLPPSWWPPAPTPSAS